MFLTTPTVHASMNPYVNLRRSPIPFRRSNSAVMTPTSPFTNNPQACELFLLSLLQGAATRCEERVRLAEDIALMSESEKARLIDFLQRQRGGAVCGAVESHACKQLKCPASQFCEAFSSDDSAALKLVDVWEILYKEVIPTMEAILFPLTLADPEFSIRRVVLTFFRDRVISKCLEPVHFRLPELDHILFTILLETDDATSEYKIFTEIANRVMGNDEHEEVEEKAGRRNTPTMSEPSDSVRRCSSEEMVKRRSRTLPNNNNNKRKSVQWEDMRKSKTVTNF